MLDDGVSRVDGRVPDIRGMRGDEAARLDAAITHVDWSRTPPGVGHVRYQAPSGDLAGYAAGPESAPRMVLVPGVTGSKEDFALMLPLLAAAGYRAESFDLAGHHDSQLAGPERLDPPRRRFDHELFVDDLVAVIESGPGPVHLLGYSFGGTVTQLIAATRPDLVASLTLLSCPPVAGQAFRATKSALGPLSRVIGPRQGAGLMLWGISRNFNRTPAHRYDFVMARMPRIRRDCVDDIIGLMRRTPDLGERLVDLPIPKLVAYGAHDLWPEHAHADFARRIGAVEARYEAAGHSPCEETPHQLTRDMLRVIETGQADE